MNFTTSFVSVPTRYTAFRLQKPFLGSLITSVPVFRSPAFASQHKNSLGVRAMSTTEFKSMIQQKNADNAVMVYSKSYCPYCSQVKGLFQQLNVPAKVVELDQIADGEDVHEALKELIGKSTVPQVFIGGVHIGGCDDTLEAKSSGKLQTLLKGAGITV